MAKSTSMENFAEQITSLIRARGWSFAAAAEVIGIDRGNLSRILRGKEGLTFERAERIAKALGAELSVNVVEKKKNSAA